MKIKQKKEKQLKKVKNEDRFYQIDHYLLFLKWAKDNFQKEKKQIGSKKQGCLILRYHFFCYMQILSPIINLLKKNFNPSSKEYQKIEKFDTLISQKLKHGGLIFSSEQSINIFVNNKEEMKILKSKVGKTKQILTKKENGAKWDLKINNLEENINLSWKELKKLINSLEKNGNKFRVFSKDIFGNKKF